MISTKEMRSNIDCALKMPQLQEKFNLVIYLRTLGARHPKTAVSYVNPGIAHQEKGERKLAVEFHNKSLAIRLGCSLMCGLLDSECNRHCLKILVYISIR
jgi:hypothetical protein